MSSTANRDPAQADLIPTDDPLLRRSVREVDPEDIAGDYLQAVARRLLDIAAARTNGTDADPRAMVGLAAPQIGIDRRVILIDTAADTDQAPVHEVFFNPRIVNYSAEQFDGPEGCFSCDNVRGSVARSRTVTMEAFDILGQPVRRTFTDLIARIAQHETDHLDGIRFPERIPFDEPWRLHWVPSGEIGVYRRRWRRWRNLCPRAQWDQIRGAVPEP